MSIAATRFVVRRGPSASRPTLGVGELGMDTDGTNAVWIGTPNGTNKQLDTSGLSGSGESNVGSNYGTGNAWYAGKSGVDLGFKTFTGSNVTFATSGNTIHIIAGTSGEVNTGSNVGTGNAWYSGKADGDPNLQFKTLVASNLGISTSAFTINIVGSVCVPFNYALQAGSVGWANMPAAETIAPIPRVRIDLTNAREMRIAYHMFAVGTSGAIIYLQQGTDSSSQMRLSNTNATITSTFATVTAWETINAGSRIDTYISVWGSRGNGAVDPVFAGVSLQVR